MIIDASALVAIICREPEEQALVARMDENGPKLTHPASIYEAALAIARIRDVSVEVALTDLQDFVARAEIAVATIDEHMAAAAVLAFDRYGKGRHPAGLNMGDCFSYGCAKVRAMPLLYKGEDFAKTDLA